MRVSFNHSEGLNSLSNQFTKGTRTEHDEVTKDRIRAEMLSRRYYKFAMARPERAKKMGINQAQVATAKMLIDKGKPSLQSIESHDADPLESMSESEMTELIRSHIKAHPEVLQALNLTPSPAIVPSDRAQTVDKPVHNILTGTE